VTVKGTTATATTGSENARENGRKKEREVISAITTPGTNDEFVA
jgi:hypothetical protein